MIPCPPLLHDNSMSILFYNIVFWSNLILNPYVIFCIIFRSPKNLKNYRWYLFYHQLVAVISDVAVRSFLTSLLGSECLRLGEEGRNPAKSSCHLQGDNVVY